MADHDLWFEDPGDEIDDDEYPDEDEFDDGSSLTVPCSDCGADIYEDAVQCPVCGAYVTHAGGQLWSGRPIWWIVVGLVGILATILVLSGLLP